MPDVSAPASFGPPRCEPPPKDRHYRYHWLIGPRGSEEPAEWRVDEWWTIGWDVPESPEEAGRCGWRWSAVATPPTPGEGT